MSTMNRHGDRDRDRDRRRERRDRSSSSSDDTPPPRRGEKPKRTGLQEYWMDGKGINREVLQRQICFMLGREAKCKPDTYKGVHGYRVTAVRPFTDEQLNDLVDISKDFEREREDHRKRSRRPEPTLQYPDSQTSQRHDHPSDPSRAPHREERGPPQTYQPSNPYDSFNPQSIYNQPPGPGYLPPGRHSPGPPPGSSGYPVPGYPGPRPPYHDPPGRPNEVPGMYNSYPDSMDIDSGPFPPAHRPAPNFPPRAMDYERDRPPYGEPYLGGHPPYGAPPPGQYPMDPGRPRHMPQMDATGRTPMGMPPNYDYGPAMSSGYNMKPEKRPRPDDYGRQPRR